MSRDERVRVFDWFSFSHWGMFRLGLFTCPEWYAWGLLDPADDDLVEWCDDESSSLQGGER